MALVTFGVACSSFSESDTPDASDGAPDVAMPSDAAESSVTNDAAPTYVATVMADRPIGYWRMNVATGSEVPDESGRNHPLQLKAELGGAHAYTLGQAGATADGDLSIAFDGTEGYATADLGNDFPFTADFSVELWAAQQVSAENLAVVASSDQGVNGLLVLTYSDISKFEAARYVDGELRDPQPVSVGPKVDLGQFHHVVATYSTTSQLLTLYVDGDNGVSVTTSGNLNLMGAAFAIGRDDTYMNNYYPGRIDEVAVYNHALTQAAVHAHYVAGHPGE